MSVEALGWAFKRCHLEDPTAKLVLLAFCNYSNDQDQSWPSHATIAKITGLSKRAVQNAIKKLEAHGVIIRDERSRENGSQSTCMVTLNVGVEFGAIGVAADAGGIAPDSIGGVNDVPRGMAGGAPPEPSLNHQSEPSLNLLPVEVKIPRAAEADKFFAERFWPNYPKRSGGNPKESARKKIVQLVTGGENPEIILDGLRRLVRGLRARQKIGSEFVPMAITWLNRKGWLDDPEPDMPAHQIQPNSGGGGFFAAAAMIRRNAGE